MRIPRGLSFRARQARRENFSRREREVIHIPVGAALGSFAVAGVRGVRRAPGRAAMDTSQSKSEMRWAFLMLVALGLAVTLTIYTGLSG